MVPELSSNHDWALPDINKIYYNFSMRKGKFMSELYSAYDIDGIEVLGIQHDLSGFSDWDIIDRTGLSGTLPV